MPSRFNGFEEIAYVEEETYTDGFEYWIVSEWGQFDILSERQFFSFGAGGLIDEVIMLDLGVAIGEFERESEYLKESREIVDFTVSASYRF
jgi:hypothetical protein